ncbi:hypothetical protein C8Q76DRAFT_15275 [Earliella scabrosa]|nr:hypothetical protein C8Q76DRAFT_15275 [Earliella scabrosa]
MGAILSKCRRTGVDVGRRTPTWPSAHKTAAKGEALCTNVSWNLEPSAQLHPNFEDLSKTKSRPRSRSESSLHGGQTGIFDWRKGGQKESDEACYVTYWRKGVQKGQNRFPEVPTMPCVALFDRLFSRTKFWYARRVVATWLGHGPGDGHAVLTIATFSKYNAPRRAASVTT